MVYFQIKRLRKEGSSLLEEEKERMKQELAKDNQQDSEDEQKVLPRLKVCEILNVIFCILMCEIHLR